MPTTFQLRCPHCGTVRVAFELVHESWVALERCWHTCAQCAYCSGLIVQKIESSDDYRSRPSEGFAPNSDWFSVEAIYPAPGGDVPDHLPDEVAHFFRQAVDNTPGNPDAAGIMFRKTLEATLRDKCPQAKGNLRDRIDEAAKVGVLTADLARYAHTIRLEGNEAAHETYEEADAQQLRLFTTLVLQYVYTLPGMQAQIDIKASAAASSGET